MGESEILSPPLIMAGKRYPPQKIPQSRIEKDLWIFPRFRHRDPKIRKNHKIKTSGSIEISSKWMKKFKKKVKKWKFCVFHVFSRSLFSVFSVKTKKWKTLITGNRWRQSWKNPWILVRTLIDGTRRWHKILKFAKLFQNNYQCNFALTAKLNFHRNLL